jgi:hypothetical protein
MSDRWPAQNGAYHSISLLQICTVTPKIGVGQCPQDLGRLSGRVRDRLQLQNSAALFANKRKSPVRDKVERLGAPLTTECFDQWKPP